MQSDQDVAWRMEGKRMVEQVYSVFCFGCESWSWNQALSGQKKRLGEKTDEATTQTQKKR